MYLTAFLMMFLQLFLLQNFFFQVKAGAWWSELRGVVFMENALWGKLKFDILASSIWLGSKSTSVSWRASPALLVLEGVAIVNAWAGQMSTMSSSREKPSRGVSNRLSIDEGFLTDSKLGKLGQEKKSVKLWKMSDMKSLRGIGQYIFGKGSIITILNKYLKNPQTIEFRHQFSYILVMLSFSEATPQNIDNRRRK